MKLVNFASFDPAHKERGVKGLANAGRQDEMVWKEFNADSYRLAEESEEASLRLSGPAQSPEEQDELEVPEGPTEATVLRSMRLVQRFFRRSVLASYRFTCAFCGLDVPALLNASHIVPWSVDVKLRADPSNGLCLCCLHDRAFDRGLMSVNSENRLVLSSRLSSNTDVAMHRTAFLDLEGCSIKLPERFLPHPSSLKYHFTAIFV